MYKCSYNFIIVIIITFRRTFVGNKIGSDNKPDQGMFMGTLSFRGERERAHLLNIPEIKYSRKQI